VETVALVGLGASNVVKKVTSVENAQQEGVVVEATVALVVDLDASNVGRKVISAESVPQEVVIEEVAEGEAGEAVEEDVVGSQLTQEKAEALIAQPQLRTRKSPSIRCLRSTTREIQL